MAKTPESMAEFIRAPRPHFRKAERFIKKSEQHRFERRKIRQAIRQSAWDDTSGTPELL